MAACLILSACYGEPFSVSGGTAQARTEDSAVLTAAAQTQSIHSEGSDAGGAGNGLAGTASGSTAQRTTPDGKLHRKVAKSLSSLRVRSKDNSSTDKLYDLTEYLGKVPGTLCAYAFQDESHVLLLTLSGASAAGSSPADEITEGTYHTYVLDLTTGKITDSVSWQQVINEDLASVTADENSSAADSTSQAAEASASADIYGADYIEIVSADPLIVHDTMNAIIYVPGSDYETIVLPRYLADAEASVTGGQLYLTSNRGIIFDVQDDGSLEQIWTLPDNFSWLSTVENGGADYLTLTTYDRSKNEEPVRIDLNPATGKARYYQVETDESAFYYSASGCGILAGTHIGSEEELTLRDTVDETVKTLRLPSSIESMLSSQNADGTSELSIELSRCSIFPDWCCWSLADSGGKPVHLYLWDTSAEKGEAWKKPSETAYELPVETGYADLSSRADSISDQYNITVVLGDNVPSSFADYNVEVMTDTEIIEGALSVLENVLSLYPDGYFKQLRGDYYRDIAIYLTGSMTPVDSTQNISNAGAFTTDENGLAIVALNLECEDLTPATVIHELDHVLDYRLESSGYLDENAWNAMNPSGFDYYYSYIDENGNSYQNSGSTQYTATGGSPVDDTWFYDPYSKTYPMEDRARLMENLLDDPENADAFYASPHIQQKLTYYFGIIRSILDDGTWPEQTSWEKALKSAE